MRAAGPEIALERVSKSFGDARIVDELSVTIEPGQFTVILGPSGCGKSTLLRLIAGLEAVSDGSIRIGGRMANVLPPQERGCGMVFQNYALYPHMTVEGNLAYGLQRAGGSRKAIAGRVAEIAGQLGLGDLLHRRPAQLSGGQCQRVAIGRAIIREPAILLMDEPLSNLDAKLRSETRVELAKLHALRGATTIMVTHDQHEAMTLADRIVLMKDGRIEQVGSPQELYHRPATAFAAEFVGSPAMNILTGQVDDGGTIRLPDEIAVLGRVPENQAKRREILIGIRPEAIVIDSHEPDVAATLEHAEDLGSHQLLYCRCGQNRLVVAKPSSNESAAKNSRIPLRLPRAALNFFCSTGRQRLDEIPDPQLTPSPAMK